MTVVQSAIRFSWAMTVFGAQQAVNFFSTRSTSGDTKPVAADAFDAVAHALEGQFDGVFRGTYEAGKQWFPGLSSNRSDVAGSKG
jgi:hypothetical protein